MGMLNGRLLVVAFEGWNDAGEAATGAVKTLKEQLELSPITEVDPELYYDYQFNRPVITSNDDGSRGLEWPGAVLYGPENPALSDSELLADDAEMQISGDNGNNVYLLIGTEPSRSWKAFAAEIIDAALAADVSAIVFLGSMLADVPHTRPISVFLSSENADIRRELDIERSTYEGPVGILSVLGEAAEATGIATVSLWASVPHYVQNAPSPKAMLALIDKLEEIVDVVIPRGSLMDDARDWETGIDALAGEDEDMAAYIRGLEQARDTVESPEASGEAIAREFEQYLRKSDDRADVRDNKAGQRSESPARDKPAGGATTPADGDGDGYSDSESDSDGDGEAETGEAETGAASGAEGDAARDSAEDETTIAESASTDSDDSSTVESSADTDAESDGTTNARREGDEETS